MGTPFYSVDEADPLADLAQAQTTVADGHIVIVAKIKSILGPAVFWKEQGDLYPHPVPVGPQSFRTFKLYHFIVNEYVRAGLCGSTDADRQQFYDTYKKMFAKKHGELYSRMKTRVRRELSLLIRRLAMARMVNACTSDEERQALYGVNPNLTCTPQQHSEAAGIILKSIASLMAYLEEYAAVAAGSTSTMPAMPVGAAIGLYMAIHIARTSRQARAETGNAGGIYRAGGVATPPTTVNTSTTALGFILSAVPLFLEGTRVSQPRYARNATTMP